MSVVMQSYDKHFQAHLALLTYLQQQVYWQKVNKPRKRKATNHQPIVVTFDEAVFTALPGVNCFPCYI